MRKWGIYYVYGRTTERYYSKSKPNRANLSIRNSGMLSDFGGLCKAGSKDVGKERIVAENTWRCHCGSSKRNLSHADINNKI